MTDSNINMIVIHYLNIPQFYVYYMHTTSLVVRGPISFFYL